MKDQQNEILATGQCLYNRQNGLAYVTNDGFFWKREGQPVPQVSLLVQNIKSIHMNSSSERCLLKVTAKLNLGVAETGYLYQFTGSLANTTRDNIKTRLAEILGRYRNNGEDPGGKLNITKAIINLPLNLQASPDKIELSSLEIKARAILLSKYPQLARLHKEMVIGGVISENEFWDNRQHLLKFQKSIVNQSKGYPSTMLTELRPSKVGDTIKYTLTPTIIYSIFVKYPGVHKAYKEQVPHNITEKEFWIQYFQSKLFYRDRTKYENNIFDKYDLEETQVSQNVHLPLDFDLRCTIEDHLEESNPNLEYTVPRDMQMLSKFNKHSESILKNLNQQSTTNILKSEIPLTDLNNPEEETYSVLNIGNEAQYLKSLNVSDDLIFVDNDIEENFEQKLNLHSKWQPMKNISLSDLYISSENDCNDLINDISEVSEDQLISTSETATEFLDKRQELVAFFANVNEILRHFWSSYESSNHAKNARILRLLEACELQYRQTILIIDMPYKNILKSLERPIEHAIAFGQRLHKQ